MRKLKLDKKKEQAYFLDMIRNLHVHHEICLFDKRCFLEILNILEYDLSSVWELKIQIKRQKETKCFFLVLVQPCVSDGSLVPRSPSLQGLRRRFLRQAA